MIIDFRELLLIGIAKMAIIAILGDGSGGGVGFHLGEYGEGLAHGVYFVDEDGSLPFYLTNLASHGVLLKVAEHFAECLALIVCFIVVAYEVYSHFSTFQGKPLNAEAACRHSQGHNFYKLF